MTVLLSPPLAVFLLTCAAIALAALFSDREPPRWTRIIGRRR